jgi:hypothetical protein
VDAEGVHPARGLLLNHATHRITPLDNVRQRDTVKA